MRKIILLFAVFTAIFSLSLRAQTTVTVADGTTTSSYIPIYGYYTDAYQRVQVIYPASMLTGFADKSIQSLTFYLNDMPSSSWNATFEVKLGTTAATMFSSTSYLNNDLTTVYSGTLAFSNDNTLTITFDQPFNYTGGNLLLEIDVIVPANWVSANFYGISSQNASCYGYSNYGLSSITNVNRKDFIPKTTFFVTDIGDCVVPYLPTVTDVSSSSALLHWVNVGLLTPDHYEVSYKQESATNWTVVPEAVHSNYHLLTGLQQNSVYMARVRAFCDATTTTGYSATVSFHTACLAHDGYVVIGTGNFSDYGFQLPVSTSNNYSYSQQIYTASEVGGARSLDTLWVQYYYGTPQTRTFDVYLGNTQKTSFASSNDWVPLSALTKVFSGTVTFDNTGEGNWFAIPFNTSFMYNGTDNLVLAFEDNTGSFLNSDSKFYTNQGASNSTIFNYSNNTPNMAASPGYGSRTSSRSNLKLQGTCTTGNCYTANVAVTDITAVSAQLVFTAGTGNSSCELQYKRDGDASFTSLPTSGSSYLLTGLLQNTKYTVRIRSHCSSGWNAWKTIQFTTKTKDCTRLYVKTNGTGDGVSWNEATNDLGWALRTATLIRSKTDVAPDIWVAGGVYYGDTVAGNDAFTMQDGISVYGGFAGNEPANYNLSLRDFSAHPTILDGQNMRRVLLQQYDFNTETIWDGFTVRNGNANGYGGGARLYGNATFRNCQFSENTATSNGGGVYTSPNNSSNKIVFENCQFSHNTTNSHGGGLYSNYTMVRHCVFTHNLASNYGGGIYVYDASWSDTTVSNCLIANNSADKGGGIYTSTGSSKVVNSTIVRNTASNAGGGLYVSSCHTVANTIIWGNQTNGSTNNLEVVASSSTTFSHNAVEGGCSGESNISLMPSSILNGSLDPKFVLPSATAGHTDSTANADWHLQQGSV